MRKQWNNRIKEFRRITKIGNIKKRNNMRNLCKSLKSIKKEVVRQLDQSSNFMIR